MTIGKFRNTIRAYYRRHKRPMPWRDTRDPYRILISEIMLQQTQVSRVLDAYTRFIRLFPDIRSLARAPLEDILRAWQGLGYNRRALLLKRLAERVVAGYGGHIPRSRKILKTLPGIGEATSGAVCAFAYNLPEAFVETNIRSVFIHFFFRDRKKIGDGDIFPLIEKTLDRRNPRDWYYALMDYGVYLKQQFPNPSRKSRHYARQGKFEGSVRQIRGAVIRILVSRGRLTERELCGLACSDEKKCRVILEDLCAEGLIKREKRIVSL